MSLEQRIARLENVTSAADSGYTIAFMHRDRDDEITGIHCCYFGTLARLPDESIAKLIERGRAASHAKALGRFGVLFCEYGEQRFTGDYPAIWPHGAEKGAFPWEL